MLPKKEYEQRFDEIKGACRDIVENLTNGINVPTKDDEANLETMRDWLYRLQRKLGRFMNESEWALEDIAALEYDEEYDDEDEEEDEEEVEEE